MCQIKSAVLFTNFVCLMKFFTIRYTKLYYIQYLFVNIILNKWFHRKIKAFFPTIVGCFSKYAVRLKKTHC